MKIATINIDWFKKSNATKQKIIDAISKQNFDFLIVTENVLSFTFSENYFVYHSTSIPTNNEFQHLHYGEYLKGDIPVRTSIYTKHKSIEQLNVLDAYTSICHRYLVDGIEIIIYGTIIGTYGIKYQKEIAQAELDNCKKDIQAILTNNENVFIVGDFNTSFYENEKRELPTINSRTELVKFTDGCKIHRATQNIKDNIDHIFVTQNLYNLYTSKISVFIDSDVLKDNPHKGICLELNIRK